MHSSLWDCIGDAQIAVFDLLEQRDILALSYLCKGTSEAVQESLYSNIDWTWSEDRIPPIVTFGRTILQKPHLANLVKKVKLSVDFKPGQPLWQTIIPIATDDIAVAEGTKWIDRQGVPYGSRWDTELRKGSMEAFVALMLSQMHNLVDLQLEQEFTRVIDILAKVIGSVTSKGYKGGMSQYLQLKNVSCIRQRSWWSGRTSSEGDHTRDLVSFLRLPSIESLAIDLDNPSDLDWLPIHPISTNLISLHLADVREMHLPDIFIRTPNVTKLQYNWSYHPNFYYDRIYHRVDFGAWTEALSDLSGTLEDLTITARVYMEGEDYALPDMTFEGSFDYLCSFSRLKRIEIPLAFVLGLEPHQHRHFRDVLPEGIKTLVLRDDLHEELVTDVRQELKISKWTDDTLYKEIDHWLNNWQETHPKLKLIELRLNETGDEDWDREVQEQLIALGKQRGVEINIDKAYDRMLQEWEDEAMTCTVPFD
ncbi:Hypothetical protein D9617_4g004540 [Elsinoe fawcettii]|nr:Hypothetical protein D9617_4g004540 [Elsinoe fawcettii]